MHIHPAPNSGDDPAPSPASRTLVAGLLARLRAAGFRGDAAADQALRSAVSTDNSVYRVLPDVVVAPRDAADVEVLLRVLSEPAFAGLPVTARGGGTGTNGQSLNTGVILDFRRHMNRILELNVAERWVDVEPGVVLDELNERLAGTGLFFAPSTSTANRCTIGGMIGTDAAGKGSRVYGKTSDNLLGVELVLDGGRRLASLKAPPSWAQAMLAEVAAACHQGRDALMAAVPGLPRRFTGYDLDRARPGKGALEWWRLVVGSEGTLGLVTRARLRLVPVPRHRRLVVIAYTSFADALGSGPALLGTGPLAVETVDERVQRLARGAGLLDGLPPGVRGDGAQDMAYNFIEYAGESEPELARSVDRLVDLARGLAGFCGLHVAENEAEIRHLWSVRAASVGLLGNSGQGRRAIPFVEDCAVRPADLAAFVADFTAALDRHGLSYGIYGHIDSGCLHIRPALDLDQDVDRRRLKSISDEIYALTRTHGGLFWGEHGKGIRGAYLEDFVGPVAYAAFRRIKAAFDPGNRFNPGKLVALDKPMFAIEGTPMRPFNGPDADPMAMAFRCNGNAQCLNFARTTPMCPSFKATRDPRHSPKGRADALRDWYRGRGRPGDAARREDTMKALDLCLGCKACASACPAHVDIPEMKSRFLAEHYAGRPRPLAHYAVAALEAHGGALARLHAVLHRASGSLVRLVEPLLGLTDLPALSPRSPRSLGYPVLGPARIAAATWPENTVFVVQDAFTSLFDTPALAAVARGLELLGYAPVLVALAGGGKAAHVHGMRGGFERAAGRLLAGLRRVAGAGRPLIGVDPAFVLMLRQEYAKAGFADIPRVMLVQELLAARLEAGDAWPRAAWARRERLFLHCNETSALPQAGRQWQLVCEALGLPVEIVPTGCCGMAGLFGHQRRHQEVSKALFAMSWASHMRAGEAVYATGFSCRCQAGRLSDAVAAHPMQLVVDALEEDRPAAR